MQHTFCRTAATSPHLLLVTLMLPTAGTMAQENAVSLGPLVIEAESDDTLIQDGFVGISGRAGSKTDTPFIELPQSVSVVTEKQLDAQNPRTVIEALDYTSGTQTGTFGFDPRFDAFFIRGFEATYSGIFRDGLRQFNSPTGLFRHEPYGLEGITILKGPASALYGASNAGGLADLTTKRPTDTAFREVELQFGSHDRYQGNIDLSGPATGDGSLLYRFTGLLRDSDTELPGFPDDRLYLAPALTWKPSEDTSLTVLTEYMDATSGGTAAFENDEDGVTDLYSGIPGYNDFPQEQLRVGYEFEHRLDKTFTLRQNLRYTWLDMDIEYGFRAPDESGELVQSAGRAAEETRTATLDNQLLSDFSTGLFEHRLLAGIDYGWIDYDQQQNPFAPIPAQGDSLPLSFTEAQETRQLGLYASDEIRKDALGVTVGFRYDRVDGKTETPEAMTDTDNEEFSWRVGLSYDTPSGLVPYANYTTSFTPNVGTLISGDPANPTTGEQVELGMKYLFDDVNASLTAAVFDIQQDDAVVFQVIDGLNEQVNRGLQSRGIELEGRASLARGLNLIAAYTYLDVEITDSPGGFAGNRLNATPESNLSLWGDYTFQHGSMVGLGTALGIRYTGDSFGNDANTIRNDARTSVDVALRYDLGRLNRAYTGLDLQFNVRNLFDEREQTCAADFCYQNEGRLAIGSLRYRF